MIRNAALPKHRGDAEKGPWMASLPAGQWVDGPTGARCISPVGNCLRSGCPRHMPLTYAAGHAKHKASR